MLVVVVEVFTRKAPRTILLAGGVLGVVEVGQEHAYLDGT